MSDDATAEPLVHVIVITYNGKRHLQTCFPALARTRYSNYQTLLTDNGSTDGAPEYVEAQFPQCRVLRNGTNLGFAGGNNRALRISLREHAEFAVLLNDDAYVLDPEWLSRAVSVAQSNPRIGMIGFNIVYGAGEHDTSRTVPHTPEELTVSDVQRVDGCALFIRTSVLRKVGLFDEIYFMYAEEDDLEMRALRAGFRLVSINSPIYHVGAATSKQYPVQMAYFESRNYLRFALKNLGPLRILRRCFTLFDILCNPVPLVYRSENVVHVRMRSASPLPKNLLTYCRVVCWNLVHLRETLALRFQSRRSG